ncbi:Protein of unknown function, partial [Gryllus bimaculatus]
EEEEEKEEEEEDEEEEEEEEEEEGDSASECHLLLAIGTKYTLGTCLAPIRATIMEQDVLNEFVTHAKALLDEATPVESRN